MEQDQKKQALTRNQELWLSALAVVLLVILLGLLISWMPSCEGEDPFADLDAPFRRAGNAVERSFRSERPYPIAQRWRFAFLRYSGLGDPDLAGEGIAVLVEGHSLPRQDDMKGEAAYWVQAGGDGLVFAVNGIARMWSPSIPVIPRGMECADVRRAVWKAEGPVEIKR